MALVNPPISVLWPTILSLINEIVLADCVASASKVSLSKWEIIFFLKGTVTFTPLIFLSLIFEIKFFRSSLLGSSVSYIALIFFF